MVRAFSMLAICLILSSTLVVGCTSGSSDSPSIIGSISDNIKDIISPEDSSVNKASVQISEIQKELNKDNTYVLTEDDIATLKAENLVVNESELKAWVK
ncbi:MAG: hypothetical protein AABY53_08445 [Bdellovibrionota bacterium]